MLPVIPKISQLAPGIVRVLGMNPSAYTLQGTNSYLIGLPSSKTRFLIDTSSPNHKEYIENLRQYFCSTEINGSCISDIILTHWHPDHIGSLSAVMEFAKSLNWPLPTIHKFKSLSHPDCVDGDVVDIKPDQVFDLSPQGLGQLRVLYTPGHTDDHICLQLVPENILFSGDLILGHGSTVFENLTQYMASLRSIETLGASTSLILPGHGLEVSSPTQKIAEYIKHRMDRIESVYNALSQDQWSWEKDILTKVYSEEILRDEKLFYGALSNQYHALQYLSEEGTAESRELTKDESQSPEAQFCMSGKLWRRGNVKWAKL